MFVLCVLYIKTKKKQMQDNQDKETSTDEVQNTREYKIISCQEHGRLSVVSVALSGRGVCVGPIIRREESYRL
jgi:hypothetical protein